MRALYGDGLPICCTEHATLQHQGGRDPPDVDRLECGQGTIEQSEKAKTCLRLEASAPQRQGDTAEDRSGGSSPNDRELTGKHRNATRALVCRERLVAALGQSAISLATASANCSARRPSLPGTRLEQFPRTQSTK